MPRCPFFVVECRCHPVILSEARSTESKNPIKGAEASSFRDTLSSTRHQAWVLGLPAPLAGRCVRSFQLSYTLASLAGSRGTVTSRPHPHACRHLQLHSDGRIGQELGPLA